MCCYPLTHLVSLALRHHSSGISATPQRLSVTVVIDFRESDVLKDGLATALQPGNRKSHPLPIKNRPADRL
jgi:hypothetical protein